MSTARENFLSRLTILRESLNDSSVSDGTPADIKKNAVAVMLRSGLAVLTFAIAEDFIRDRTAEALQSFNSSTVRFGDLSDSLQNAVTISALKGVLFRADFQDKTTKLAWVLQELIPIANAQTNIENLSPYSFGHVRSNLKNKDPTEILSAFGIEGGWSTITATAKRIGLGGILDYSQAFQDVVQRRHRAAHSVKAQIPLNDLIDSATTILGTCAAFDLLLSHAIALYNAGEPPNRINGLVSTKSMAFRFTSPHPTQIGKFREQTETEPTKSLHTFKVHATLADALTDAKPRAKAKREHIVSLGANGFPDSWTPW